MPATDTTPEITLRTDLRPGDLGTIVHRHGVVYSQERGWDATFEAYVAGPLAEFALSAQPHQRLWIAEQGDRFVGCIGIVAATPDTAQLRWFLVEPSVRGAGLGKRLLNEAILFSKECGYKEIVLRTERSLLAAARLYQIAGFRKIEEMPCKMWGVDIVDEKYRLGLS